MGMGLRTRTCGSDTWCRGEVPQTKLMNVQHIRLLDVLVVAPFLFYVGTRKELSQPIRFGVVALGVATLLYNGKRYLDGVQDKTI